MSDTRTSPSKPITDTRIPGTEVPDVTKAQDPPDDGFKRWMARVAVSTAVMAAIAAISSSLGTGRLNKAMFEEIRAADQWAYYQAKGIKHTVLEGRIDTARAAGLPVPDEDSKKLARYETEQAEIKARAEEHETLSQRHLRSYEQLSRAATCAQIGIALAATALLLRNNLFWAIALVAGAAGAVFIALGLIG